LYPFNQSNIIEVEATSLSSINEIDQTNKVEITEEQINKGRRKKHSGIST